MVALDGGTVVSLDGGTEVSVDDDSMTVVVESTLSLGPFLAESDDRVINNTITTRPTTMRTARPPIRAQLQPGVDEPDG